jgi:hypothetical protein
LPPYCLNETVVSALTASSFYAGQFHPLRFTMGCRLVSDRDGLMTMTGKPRMLIETPEFTAR